MFAIINNAGKQFRVTKNTELQIDKRDLKKGEKVTFDQVLLVSDDKDQVKIGTPYVAKAQVTAEVVENFKDKKIIIFKKKRRHNYRRKNGHRQEYTKVLVKDIKIA